MAMSNWGMVTVSLYSSAPLPFLTSTTYVRAGNDWATGGEFHINLMKVALNGIAVKLVTANGGPVGYRKQIELQNTLICVQNTITNI